MGQDSQMIPMMLKQRFAMLRNASQWFFNGFSLSLSQLLLGFSIAFCLFAFPRLVQHGLALQAEPTQRAGRALLRTAPGEEARGLQNHLSNQEETK